MKRKSTFLAAVFLLLALVTNAQQTYNEMEQLTVNENVTTILTAPEPVRLVDISTDKVEGDKPIDNVVRLKPQLNGKDEYKDGDIIAIVTVVTERFRSQYALIYTTRMEEAVTDKEILYEECQRFHNPAVSMSTEDMVLYARRIWQSPAKYRNIKAHNQRLTMRLNNVYTVGQYFFLDFSVENKTNLRFDIDELRVKLVDKKNHKATNVQTIELTPVLRLEERPFFYRGYRDVVVLEKMTFPNDKVLTIELSEKQISGRTISITIDYEDVLSADSFDSYLFREE